MVASITGRASFGAEVQFLGSTGAGARPAIAGLLNIVSPQFSKTVIDITNHGTTDNYQQVMPSALVRTAPITLSCVYLTTSSMMTYTIPTAMDNRAKSMLVITFAGTSSMAQIVCEGYVTNYKITTPLDDKITFDMTFKAIAKPTVQTAT